MIRKITKADYDSRGGMTNPKCSRKMVSGRWQYYYDFD